MRVLEIAIRTIAGILLVLSVAVVALLSSIRAQRDVLPRVFGYYVEILEDSSMLPAAPEGALVVLKETNPYEPGDIVACLMDNNTALTARIVSIDGQTEGVSVSVPYEELANSLGTPGMTMESAMPYDPDVVLRCDNGGEPFTAAADRLMAKAVFISGALGVFLSMYQHTAWAFAIIAAFAVICIWPFRHKRSEPVYREQDIDGPWIQ